MSKIVTNTIETSTGGPVTLTKQHAAKAWVNFDGTGGDGSTISPRDSFNFSSVSDGGTGVYTANLTNSFGAADFAVSGTSGNNLSFTFTTAPTGTVVAGSISGYTSGSTIALADNSTVSLLGFGDLA